MGRSDGRRLKHADPMYTVAAHIMTERNDALNMVKIYLPVEPMHNYLREQKKQGHQISHIGLVLAAFVRTVAEYPQLNRFIVNRKLYARDKVTVSMVVLQPGTEDSETESKMVFELTDDIFTAQQKIYDYISHNRDIEADNSTEKAISVLVNTPGLLRVGVKFLKWLDKHGWMPKAIIEASPFHATMTISNLGSLRTNYIYHHVYNFGTTSLVLTMGNTEEVPSRKKGEIVFERCIPCGITMDERICHGSYYAIAFKRFAEYLRDPSKLEGPPRVVNKDVD